MDHTTSLFLNLLVSAVGAGYIIYGRKQRQGIALLCGIVLCAYPYFVDNAFLYIAIGLVCMVAPFLIKA